MVGVHNFNPQVKPGRIIDIISDDEKRLALVLLDQVVVLKIEIEQPYSALGERANHFVVEKSCRTHITSVPYDLQRFP